MKQAAQRCSAAASEASVSCVRATERLAHARLRLETRVRPSAAISSAAGLASWPSQPSFRRATHAREPHLRRAAASARSSGGGSELPQDWTQVRVWPRRNERKLGGPDRLAPAGTRPPRRVLCSMAACVCLGREACVCDARARGRRHQAGGLGAGAPAGVPYQRSPMQPTDCRSLGIHHFPAHP